ncbi:MAG: hypothetical protein AAGA17_00220 [Actinomycetota bacterium]
MTLALSDVAIAGLFGIAGALITVTATALAQWFEIRRERRRAAREDYERIRSEQFEAADELARAVYLLHMSFDQPTGAMERVDRVFEAYARAEMLLPKPMINAAREMVGAVSAQKPRPERVQARREYLVLVRDHFKLADRSLPVDLE